MNQIVAGKRLAFGAIANWFAFAANLGVAFFLAPFLINRLGDVQYGLWIFVESLLAYLTLFDLGLGASLVRFIARYETQSETHLRNRLINTALAFYATLGGGALLCGGGVITLLTSRVSMSESLPQNQIVPFGVLMAVNLALTLPMSVFPSIFDGLGRFGVKSIVRMACLGLRTAAILFFMRTDPSLFRLGMILFVTNVLEHFVLACLCFRYLPNLKFSCTYIDWETFRLIKGYSLNAFILMLAGRASVQTGPILVGLLLSAPEVTFFGIALRLSEFAKALPRSATNTLTAAFSRLDAQNNAKQSRRLFLNASRLALWVIVPIQLGMIFHGRGFLQTWLGSENYVTQVYPTLVILSLVLFLVIAQSVAARVLYGVGELRWFARLACLEAMVNLGLGIVLAPHYGIKGVALGIMLPNVFMNLWVIFSVCRLLKISLRAYARSVLLPPLLGGGLLCGIWLLSGSVSMGWYPLILIGGIAIVPYGLFVVFWERKRNRFTPQQPEQEISTVGLVSIR